MVEQKRKSPVDSDSVGNPSGKFSLVQTIRFVIHDFKNRKEKVGQAVESRTLRAHGHRWQICVYPRGDRDAYDPDNDVSCYLMSMRELSVKFAIRIKNERCETQYDFRRKERNGFGFTWPRSSFLQYHLDRDGSLTIEVDIQVKGKRVWYPKELRQQDFLVKLYHDMKYETMDVVFDVCGKEYRAHKSVLSLQANGLFELSKEFSSDVTIPLSGISQETFQRILDFAYTIQNQDIETEAEATDILLAANRFGCTGLKLFAESVLVDKFLTPETASTLLILGDSSSSALLKEAALELIAANPITARESEGWPKVEESNKYLREILHYSSFGNSSIPSGCDDEHNIKIDVDHLDVTTLRTQLEEANLEVDGCREILVKRLKEYTRFCLVKKKQKLRNEYLYDV